jgi:hypothetical protein
VAEDPRRPECGKLHPPTKRSRETESFLILCDGVDRGRRVQKGRRRPYWVGP